MKVLVISPHPDDEALGCGGAIRRHVLEGDLVYVTFLSSGEGGGDPAVREVEAQASQRVLGVEGIHFLREPDGHVELERTLPQLQFITAELLPDVIYAPHWDDAHPDHQTAYAVADLLVTAAELRLYEIWTPLRSFDLLIDISREADVKRQAVRQYKSQIVRHGFDEAILALNRYRGEMHGPNKLYAECFAVRKSPA